MGAEGLSYAVAGVDIEAYERALERVKPLIAATHCKEVAVGVGPFAGLYELPGGWAISRRAPRRRGRIPAVRTRSTRFIRTCSEA